MMKPKKCTDLEQSKKLAEILPVESADMCFNDNEPCWSLAALLDQLEGRNFLELVIKYDDGQYYLFYMDDWGSYNMKTKLYDNLVDACVEMILELKERKLL